MATASLPRSREEAQRTADRIAAHLVQLLPPGRLLIGLSGGPDSTLLLYILKCVTKLHRGFSLRAVHCIHGLDADDPIWLAHCQKLCAMLQVPLTLKKLNIVYKNRESPEDSSRQERYAALLSELKTADYLCLGHQGDDNVENLFLALKRGAGPQGLAGMHEITEDRRGTIVRPLLHLSRKQIEALTDKLELPTVFDISNTYLKFERNFFRLQILPRIKERFPSFPQAAARSQQLCALEHDLAERFIAPLLHERADQEKLRLNCTGLDWRDEHLCLMLLRAFCQLVLEQPPELALLRQALQLMAGTHGRVGRIVLQQGAWQLQRFKQYLYLTQPRPLPFADSREHCVQLSIGQSAALNGSIYTLKAGAPPSDSQVGWYRLPPAGAELIFNAAGSLKLKAVGREQRRELKKLYGEFAVPQWDRPFQPLVRAHGEIWGLGRIFVCDAGQAPEDWEWVQLNITPAAPA